MPSAVEAPVPAAASATLRPTVVFNGTGYLVLWTYASSNQPTGRIWGTRVDLNGNPLELWGFPVADPGPLDDGLHPIAAAFDGTHYLVVWELYGVIYGKLIDATGTPLPAGQFTIASNPNFTYSEPVVTHDGKQYVVVYQGSEILATRVSNAGAILNSTALTVSRTGSAMTDSKPAIAFDGTNTVVVWYAANLDGARILAARIDTNGSLLGTKDIVVSDTAAKPQNPDIVFGSSNGLVVWEDTRNVTTSGGTSDIYGALLGKNGSVSSAGLVVASGVAAKHEPAVSLDGTNFLVVWEDGRTSGTLYVEKIYGVRITAAGAPVEVPFRISQGAGNHDYARVASDGTSALVVFEGAGPFGTTVVNGSVGGMRVKSGTIQTSANLILSTRGNRQQAPAAAFDGSKHLVVWEDDRKGYPSIWGVRVDETGKPESATIDIGQGLDQTSPRVAFNGTDYLVVWLDCQAYSGIDCSRYEVRGARVSRDGQVSDTVDGFYIGGTTAQSLAVGSNGKDFLVAWQNGFYDRSNLHAARVGADGVVVDTTPLIVCDAANGQYQPRVASDGTNYLVVWNDMRTGTRGDIYGAGISSAGQVLHANGFPIANRVESEWNADVAFNGNDYFVVWSRQNPSPAMDDIFGSRVTPAWAVVDAASPQVVISEATPQTDPRITFARDEYIVDWVNGDSLSPNQMDLRVRRLNRDGTVVNATPMILAAGQSYNEQHEVVAGADGSFMVTYSRTEPSPLGTYTRVYVRTASRLGQGTQCSVSAE